MYAKELKEKVVKEYKNGATITELSDKYGIVPSTVFFWVKYWNKDRRYTKYPVRGSLTNKQMNEKLKGYSARLKKLEDRVKVLEGKKVKK